MQKRLVINDKAKFINFRNRKVRTPVTLTITDAEVKNLKLRMSMEGIQDWRFEEIHEEKIEVVDFDFIGTDDVEVEELETEPTTILEKLIEDGDCE